MTKNKMISKKEAKYLREQFSPAFAGYVTDGDVSDRDILATIMDLVVKGAIGIDVRRGKGIYTINKIILREKQDFLMQFEQEFISEIFGKKKQKTKKQIQRIIMSKKLHKIIKNNINALIQYPIIKKELSFKTKKGHPIIFTMNGKNVEDKETAEAFDKMMKILSPVLVWVGIVIAFIGIIGTIKKIYVMSWLILQGAFFVVVSLLLRYLYQNSQKTMKLTFENNLIPITKKRYVELFDYLKAMPLKQQRFANEFMPYAIAFGLDTSWNKSFGIEEEIIVRS